MADVDSEGTADEQDDLATEDELDTAGGGDGDDTEMDEEVAYAGGGEAEAPVDAAEDDLVQADEDAGGRRKRKPSAIAVAAALNAADDDDEDYEVAAAKNKEKKRRRGGSRRGALHNMAESDFEDKPQTAEKDGWGLAPFPGCRSAEFLYRLSLECDSGRKTWANLTYTGPAVNRNFAGLLENFPCSNPVCCKSAYRGAMGGSPGGGGKMYCLLRFLIDPEHVQPVRTLHKALSCLQYGKEVRRLVGTFAKSLEEKRHAHDWGQTHLDESGVWARLNLVAKQGDATVLKDSVAAEFQRQAEAGSDDEEAAAGQPGVVVAADPKDPAFIDDLRDACYEARKSWANLCHLGPSLNHNFRSILENFPCNDSRCMRAKLQGGAKMFCLLRFALDPGHVQPQARRANALRCFSYGTEIRRFAGTMLKTFEEKRHAHSWGSETPLDKLGVIKALAQQSKHGDIKALMLADCGDAGEEEEMLPPATNGGSSYALGPSAPALGPSAPALGPSAPAQYAPALGPSALSPYPAEPRPPTTRVVLRTGPSTPTAPPPAARDSGMLPAMSPLQASAAAAAVAAVKAMEEARGSLNGADAARITSIESKLDRIEKLVLATANAVKSAHGPQPELEAAIDACKK